MNNYYIENKETGKIELHFEKDYYSGLSDEIKREIKSNFLWSRYATAWVSRCKFPNLYRPKEVAKKIGLTDAGAEGERLSFEEQQEVKMQKADRRADKYEYLSNKANSKGEALQKPINDMHGDIAFFTQPNINTTAGRAFTRRRDRMWDSFEKGFEEFKKSDYYKEKAETARQNAKKTKDKGFCERRMDEATKTIKAQTKCIEHYEEILEKLNNGEQVGKYTVEKVEGWLEHSEDMREEAIGKYAYYAAILDELGGIINKDELKEGDIVEVYHWGKVRFIKGARKNFTFEFLEKHMKYADGTPMQGKASFAEIIRKV